MDKRKEYIDFITGQMKYFDNKSIAEKKKYRTYAIIALIANALIPVVSTSSSTPFPFNVIIAILSATAAIANGISMTDAAATSWKHYRNTFTDLETVYRAYNTHGGEYRGLNEDEAFDLLFDQCEAVLHNDREIWSKKLQMRSNKPEEN